MSFSDALAAVSQVGFPIVVTAYLLLRFERKVDGMQKSNEELKDAIYKLVDTMKKNV